MDHNKWFLRQGWLHPDTLSNSTRRLCKDQVIVGSLFVQQNEGN